MTLWLPRRATMVGLLLIFAVGHVVGALTSSFELLFVSRVISALACAGFWAVGAATCVSLVPPTKRGRAMATLVGGLTIANIIGVPVGAYIGQHAGWRTVFWAVATLAAIATVGVLVLVPEGKNASASGPRLRAELGAYANRQVWLALGTTALISAAIFGTFSYLDPLLTDVGGLPENSVPGVLALFGVGSFIGISLGGRLADSHPFGILYYGIGATVAILFALASTGRGPASMVVLTFCSAPRPSSSAQH
jgi:DHA1 family chloramphenicol resistance protein-like MFS transporter